MPRRKLFCWPLGTNRCSRRPTLKLPNPYCQISSRARRLLRIFIQYCILTFVMLIIVLWLGRKFQERQADNARDTLYLYAQPVVCGLSGARNVTNTTQLTLKSFPDAATANAANNTVIAHCGDCGQCSNPSDIAIYDATKNTLFGDTVKCAKRSLLWGRKTASVCMKKTVGFTDGCNDCWIENIMCDLRKCVFVCLWHSIFSEVDGGGDVVKLNSCTNCDEKRCGPAFVKCAGANRRRTGILSDIERDQDQEICTEVDEAWWTDENLQLFWKAQAERDKEEADRKKVDVTPERDDSSGGNN